MIAVWDMMATFKTLKRGRGDLVHAPLAVLPRYCSPEPT